MVQYQSIFRMRGKDDTEKLMNKNAHEHPYTHSRMSMASRKVEYDFFLFRQFFPPFYLLSSVSHSVWNVCVTRLAHSVSICFILCYAMLCYAMEEGL